MNENRSMHPILYVDDEKDNLTVFHSAFRRDYIVYTASSGREGIETMKNNEIHLVITDQRMPEMTGTTFLEKIIPDYPDCIRMVLTGFSDIEAVIQAINTGRVYRYITKPWNREELKITIDNGLETYELKQQNRKLFEDLKEANKTLEQKVIERTKKIENQNREITDGIRYACRIQKALSPPEEDLEKLLPDYFILNRPKEIVSGDYFWAAARDSRMVVAVADCTGHGVPGAFMSILGMAFLNEIVNKVTPLKANEILNQLRAQVIKALHQTGKMDEARDGMEMAICILDYDKNRLEFSGAFRPLYYIRDDKLHELKGDKMPIGIYDLEESSFRNKEIPVKKGDIIYLFSDGYIDQLGGAGRKTFRSGKFRELLLEISRKPMQRQKMILEKTLDQWRGDIEQIDDILIMGIKI